MDCKGTCKFGHPAKIFDGPVMLTVESVRLALKRSAKGSPERRRLEDLLASQARLCWSCGKRCSEGEATELSHAAGQLVNPNRR